MKHGLKSSYDNHKCRCGPCSAAASAWQKEYRLKNKAKIAESNRQWREAHPDYERNRIRDKDQRAAYNHRYYIAEPYERLDIYVRDEGICYLCDQPVSVADFHIEHVIPVSFGGADAEWNVGIAHPFCNLQKHTKLVAKLPRVLAERATEAPMLLGRASFAPRGRERP